MVRNRSEGRDGAMEFRILGPLELALGDRVERLASAKERALLTLLVTSANQVVPADRLADAIWGDSKSAAKGLRVLVSRLRKTLAALDEREYVETRSPGYVLVVEPGEVDALRFAALATRGRALLAAGDADGAARTLREALDL